jgi:hypothetical protein
MHELSDLLAKATAAIEPGYFRLSIHGRDPVYRERVYCYELYHQMRKLWPNDCAFCLNGEVDKAAHPILMTLGADGFKPDLLVHRPGDMGGNHAVMEVKSARAVRSGSPKASIRSRCFAKRSGTNAPSIWCMAKKSLITLSSVLRKSPRR